MSDQVFEDNFDIFLCYFLYRVAKDLGIDLDVIRIVFECCLDSVLKDLEVMMALLFSTFYIISIQFPDNAKPMPRRMRSRSQYYSAKPMSKQMRSRCQDECEADVNIMRSLCQEKCEADVSIILRSRCQNKCEADVRMNAKPMSI